MPVKFWQTIVRFKPRPPTFAYLLWILFRTKSCKFLTNLFTLFRGYQELIGRANWLLVYLNWLIKIVKHCTMKWWYDFLNVGVDCGILYIKATPTNFCHSISAYLLQKFKSWWYISKVRTVWWKNEA